jgi:c-di-GMP-binding flagellar brake protein YcgR
MIGSEENRVAPRKILRVRARVVVQGGATLNGKTVDISASGICILVEGPVPVGHTCMIIFDAMVKGAPKQVNATGKVVYSIFSRDGFRTGFQFNQLTPANTALINDIVTAP